MTKICTSIEQSEKLIELGIDINTADMYWWSTSKRSYIEAMDDGDFNEAEGHICAWSLSALLNFLPHGTRLLKSATDEMYHCDCPKGNINKWFDNPLDAAFEIIIWLLENKKDEFYTIKKNDKRTT